MNIIHYAVNHRSHTMAAKKLVYPAADRNKDPILSVLKRYIQRGINQTFLEISSGSGQHVAHFAPYFPHVTFYPSEYDPRLLSSIAAYAKEYSNIKSPLQIDITTDFRQWGNGIFKSNSIEYIYNANMMHISPYQCTIGLFNNAGQLLKPNGLLFTYGPYAFDGQITPQSNVNFNKSLKSQDPSWGLRDVTDLKKLAEENNIELIEIVDMPANNKTIIWKKLYQGFIADTMYPTIKILDGGFSGQLSKHVGEKIDGDPLWTARFLATNPTAVYTTHLDFLQAGADIIETNTYQASVPGLTKYLGINESESLDLLATAVQLAKKAVDDYVQEKKLDIESRPKIAGSCGPYGAYLHNASEYTGSYGKTISQEELIDWHRPRVKALLDAGVDLLALETIPCVEEAEALLELLREYPYARAWLSFSCQNDRSIADGNVFKDVALHCYRSLPSQIVAIGINCIDPSYVTPLLQGINANVSLKKDRIPLVAYPNRGGSYSANSGWTAVSDDHLLKLPISEWLDIGVRYIGGCCKIFAEDIETIRSEVNRYCMQTKV